MAGSRISSARARISGRRALDRPGRERPAHQLAEAGVGRRILGEHHPLPPLPHRARGDAAHGEQVGGHEARVLEHGLDLGVAQHLRRAVGGDGHRRLLPQPGQRGMDVLPRLGVGEVEHRQVGEQWAGGVRHGRPLRRVPRPARPPSCPDPASDAVRSRSVPPMTGAAVAPLPDDDLGPLADLVARRHADHREAVLLVGLAGGVGVGKSVAATAVAADLRRAPPAAHHGGGERRLPLPERRARTPGPDRPQGLPGELRPSRPSRRSSSRCGPVRTPAGAGVRPPLLRRAARAGGRAHRRRS